MISIQVLIIEDEAPAYRRLDNLLASLDTNFQVVEVIDSIVDAVNWLKNHKSPDLIFSDIQLSDGLSFEIFKKIEIVCPIIFTTAYDEYMLSAFKTNGLDYLLKPIKEEDLKRSIEKFKRFHNTNDGNQLGQVKELLKALESKKATYRERFLVKIGDRLIPIKSYDIAYFSYRDGGTEIIHQTGKSYLIDQPLDELESELDPSKFFRLNRQFLASIDSIDVIHRYFNGKLKIDLKPTPEEEVLVSREKASRFKSWMDGKED